MILQIIKLRTELSEEELIRTAKAREPQFKAIPGIIQKYYTKPDQPEHICRSICLGFERIDGVFSKV